MAGLFKAKLAAFSFHFVLTLVVALLCGALVYGVWYPGGIAEHIGGEGLFTLIMLVEVCVGPLLSLVVYNPKKSKGELVRDYGFIFVIQIAALSYGLYSVAQSRPVFSIFVKDRIEIVAAVELEGSDFSGGRSASYQSLSWLGPNRICVEFPESIEERNHLLFSAVAGKDIQLYPKYYRDCELGEVESVAYSGDQLLALAQEKGVEFDEPEGEFTWLPAVSRFGAVVEIYPQGNIDEAYYLGIDPF